MDYRYNIDHRDNTECGGVSYNQVLDITDIEGSGVTITEPVTLDEAKNFCKIDINETEENNLITALITAARQMCEQYCNVGFVNREIVVVLNNCNGGSFLPLGPVGTISSVTDIEGNALTNKVSGTTWKQLLWPTISNITLTYDAGYTDLPEMYKTALLNAIMYLYDNRSQGADNIGPIATMLLKPVRRVW